MKASTHFRDDFISSNVQSIGYLNIEGEAVFRGNQTRFDKQGFLFVTFHSGPLEEKVYDTYIYNFVPLDVWEQLNATADDPSGSIGKAVNLLVKKAGFEYAIVEKHTNFDMLLHILTPLKYVPQPTQE